MVPLANDEKDFVKEQLTNKMLQVDLTTHTPSWLYADSANKPFRKMKTNRREF